MGMALAAHQCRDMDCAGQSAFLKQAADNLAHARPTTANRYGIITSRCAEMGFDTTVITDTMAAYVMERAGVDLFTSAADTIARDGHIANKIGTFQLAILSKHFGIPYFVTGIPDADKPSTKDIVIELRDPAQVLFCGGISHAAPGVKATYPSFDVTPPELISGIVTDRGVFPVNGLE